MITREKPKVRHPRKAEPLHLTCDGCGDQGGVGPYKPMPKIPAMRWTRDGWLVETWLIHWESVPWPKKALCPGCQGG